MCYLSLNTINTYACLSSNKQRFKPMRIFLPALFSLLLSFSLTVSGQQQTDSVRKSREKVFMPVDSSKSPVVTAPVTVSPTKASALSPLTQPLQPSPVISKPDTLQKPENFNQDTTSVAPELSYQTAKEYLIDAIQVKGTKYLDNKLLINISHLRIGSKVHVPGDEKISNAIKSLWAQGLFENVGIDARIHGESVTLILNLEERPRLGKIEIHGIHKSAEEDIRKKLKDIGSRVVTDNVLNDIERVIKKYFNDKGFLNTQVTFTQRKDDLTQNKVVLVTTIDKNKKARVDRINLSGNVNVKRKKLLKFMKNTKEREWYKVFGSKKFLLNKYQEEDKESLVSKYSNLGYRDARILSDTIVHNADGNVTINIKLNEGKKYYFGNITWFGNARYTSEFLSKVLGIKKGDVYDQEKLEKRLGGSQNGDDVSSLYLDNGYLFYHNEPTEVRVYKDTVDLQMKMQEGAQANYNRITVKGNDRTNDKVVLRQVMTIPGEKFSKAEIIRTTRELAQLGYFDEQKLNPVPHPNPEDGTVDIEYDVVEKPSDQVELSGGFGGGRIVGSLGLTFNNFSIQKLLRGKWEGLLPQGDGQKVQIKASANGKQYQVYSLSFLEPWFGGHKPVTFGVNLSLSQLQYSYGVARSDPRFEGANIYTASVSLGKQLRWPDNYFNLQYALTLSKFDLKNFPGFIYNTGQSYNFSLTQTLSRNSIDAPIYPTSGSNIRFSIEATPPYSSLRHLDYASPNLTPAGKFQYTEYHKWKFDATWFIKLYGKLVLNTQARFGFIGYYNPNIGVPQLNRFLLGGDGMTGYNFLQSTEIIGLRGYQNYSIIPPGGNTNTGSPIYDKFTVELRHPVINSASATIYMLGFLEGGNTWSHISDYSPYNIKRSAGLGVRIYLPIFGLLGLDYGYGFDKIPGNSSANKGQFNFTINKGLDGF